MTAALPARVCPGVIMETFSSKASLEARISTFERKTKSSFVLMTKDKTFGVEDWRNTDRAQKKSLYWKIPSVPSDGIPFLTLGRKILGCHQGKSKHTSKSVQENEQNTKKTSTKKVGCPAQIQIHHVIKFPDYEIKKDSSVYKQKLQKKKLREVLLTDPNLKVETVFYVDLPAVSDHNGHPTDGMAAGKREKPDPLIKQEIMKLTRDGVCKVSEMKRHINAFVKNVFEEEEVKDTSRRRYHPLDKDIRNFMQKAKELMCLAKENQENLGCLVEEWQEEKTQSPFKYCTHTKEEGGDEGDTSKPDIVTEALDNGTAVPYELPSSDVEEKIYVNLPPQRRSRKHSLRHKCVGLLKQMMESVQQVEDTEYLEELHNDLHCKLIEVQLRTPFEVVIEVGSPQKKRAKGDDGGDTIMKKKKT